MNRLSALFLLAGVSLPGPAFGDASFRQVMEIKFNVPMPAGAAPSGFPFNGPMEIVCHVKGPRAYSSFGQMASIMDSGKNELILLDTTGKRYATTSLSDYMSKIAQTTGASTAEMPEAARQILQNMQFKVESRDTGRTETIFGINTTESDILLSISIPMPVPLPGTNGNGLEVSGTFQVWKPQAAEIERMPVLREVNGYYEQARKTGTDVTSAMSRIMSSLPGFGDKLGDFMSAMQKGGAMAVRMRGAFSMPGLAAILQQARAGGAQVPDIPDGPLVEFHSDLKDLNTDAIADSTFQVPAGYTQAPVEDLIKTFMPAR